MAADHRSGPKPIEAEAGVIETKAETKSVMISKRSVAAKKGWETRRRNKMPARLQAWPSCGEVGETWRGTNAAPVSLGNGGMHYESHSQVAFGNRDTCGEGELEFATDRLQSFGQSLYGEHWLKPMSRDLKIRPDTVAKWMSGKRQADQVIFEALAILFAYHKKAVVKASEILDRNRKKAD